MKIPRNSTDILSKHLTYACPNGVLEVIGIADANIVRALPTELNQVVIRQRHTDIVLEQDDGLLLHLEFQKSKESTLYRFLAYDVALAEHFGRKLRTVVLYTGNIDEGPTDLDIGTASYSVENVFLNQLNGDDALEVVERHLAHHEWTPQDRIRLAFAFHMHFEKLTQKEAFEEVLTLTRQIDDQEEQDYVVALILGLSGHQLKKNQEKKIKEMLKMTNVVREIEEEALQKGFKKGRKEGHKEGRKEGHKEGHKEGRKETLARNVRSMLQKGESEERIADLLDISLKEVRAYLKQS